MTIPSLGAVLVNHKISSGEQTEEEILQLLYGNANIPYDSYSAFSIDASSYTVIDGEVCSYSYDKGTATFLAFFLDTTGDIPAGTANIIWHGQATVADKHHTIKTYITSNKGKDITITTDLYVAPAEYKVPVYNNASPKPFQAYPATANGTVLGCFTGTSPNGYSLVYSLVGCAPGNTGLSSQEYLSCFSVDSKTGCLTVIDAEKVFSLHNTSSSIYIMATDTGPYQFTTAATISLRVA